jgi:hypothetical protein
MNFTAELDHLGSFNLMLSFLPLVVEAASLAFKLVVLYFLYNKTISFTKNKTIFYIILILVADIFATITLICRCLNHAPFYMVSNAWLSAVSRMDFVFGTIQYYSLLCFFRELSSRKISKWCVRPILLFVAFFSCYFFCVSIYTVLTLGGPVWRAHVDIIRAHSIYMLSLALYSLLLIYRNAKVEPLKILRKHIMTLGQYFMLPYFCFKIVESDFFPWRTNVMVAPITSGLLTFLIYYCARRLTALRFLNMQSHVVSQASGKFNFIDDFKDTLGEFGAASNVHQLAPITKDFFYKAFGVPHDRVSLYFRGLHVGRVNRDDDASGEEARVLIEKKMSSNSGAEEYVSFVKRDKIIIRDEIEFTQFYNKDANKVDLVFVIEFLKELKADVFLPIFNADKIVGWIIVDELARPGEFYTDVERDEMLIYSDYIGRVAHLLLNTSLEALLLREREAKVDAYRKNRMLSLLKNSIVPFLNTSKMRKIGVLTYKSKKFVSANQAVKDLIGIDLNIDRGLDFTQRVIELGDEVSQSQMPKRRVLSTPKGEVVVVNASPNLVRGNIVMTISNPSLSDFAKDHLQMLKDDSKWDYLLALKVSEEGRFINQLLPADTVIFVNTKITFFEHVITRKTLLFEMPSEDDVRAFAHVAHRINERSVFEEVRVERMVNDEHFGARLFGINPAFEVHQEQSLFEKLHKRGTLVLYNVHLLSLDLQKRLFEYIVSGKWVLLKSDEQREADVFLICATNQNLIEYVERGEFLKELYVELHKSTLWIPSLTNMPDEDVLALAEGFRQQVVYAKVYQNLLQFNDSDKARVIASGCISIHELKAKVQSLILKKTRKQTLSHSAIIDPAYSISDLDLIEAARLGRQSIKDPKVLAMLMRKFEFNQSKVAQFLGVNRSTVSRRCEQYGIDTETNSMNRSPIA